MLWRVLAETVMVLHLLIIAFLAVATILLALGVFKGHRNWRYFFYGVAALALGFGIASSTRILRTCPITDLEYMLRRQYDLSERWMRTRSLLGTVVYNLTGAAVPEFVFTIGLGIAIVVMILSLIFWREPESVA